MSESCRSCNGLPLDLPNPATIYLGLPEPEWTGGVTTALKAGDIEFLGGEHGILGLRLPKSKHSVFCRVLQEALNATALEDVRVLVTDSGATPNPWDLMRGTTLSRFIYQLESAWFLEVMRKDRFTTHFQPIVEASTGEVYAHECLLRGVRPDGSLIPPQVLFGAAKASGLLTQLDRQARLTALKNVASLNVPGMIFINFNPCAVHQPDTCLKSTVDQVDELGIDHKRIVFEVVESEQFGDSHHVNKIIEFCRSVGFGVALDDLGAGYSSLNILTKVMPDYVKLDRQLLIGIHQDPIRQKVVRHLIDMSRSLGIRTVLEGIELKEEADWAIENQGDLIQGFYYAKPSCMPCRSRFSSDLLAA